MNEQINLVAIWIADGFGAFLCILMLGARVWTRNRDTQEVKLFRALLLTTLITCFADICAFTMDGVPGVKAFIILYLVNTWLFLSNMIMGTVWFAIVLLHISKNGIPKNQKFLIGILDIIGTVVLIINFFVPIAFSIDENNVYSRGPLYGLYIAIEVITVIDSFVVYFVLKRKNSEAVHFPVWQFVIPISVSIMIQAFVYGISLIVPSLSLAVCGVILGMFSENEAEADILRQNERNARIILEQGQQLEEALALAESANRAKTTFLNSMSHDIRTPMNAIIGYTGLAKSHIDNKEQISDYLQKIEKSSDYLLTLINEVLDMSRIESGKMTLNEKTENISDIVDTIKDIVQADISAKHHEFIININNIENEYVICDKLRLNQVLLNILSNSIKYTPENGKITMSVSEIKNTSEDTAKYEFCISDNGIGMDEEFIHMLFEPFTRVNSSTVSGIQGTGLGMSISKYLVDMMKGKIDVQSRSGIGTWIKVEFDFRISNGDDYEKETNENDSTEINTEIFKGKRILLVEDNELNREIATEILEESGFIVDKAEDGKVAVEKISKAQEGDYELILMDIQMPKMDGYEATKQIRAMQPEEEHIPIIAMTANAFEEDRKLALDIGMDDHLAKPIDPKNMLKVISKYIKQ